MRNALIALLLFVSPAVAAIPDDRLLDFNQLVDQTHFAINGGCSGTLIDIDNGYILTAAHCIEHGNFDGSATVENIVYHVKTFGKPIRVNHELDLAVIQTNIDYRSHGIYREAVISAEYDRGQEIHVVGNQNGLYGTYTSGNLSSIRTDFGKFPKAEVIQTDATIMGGNSGGMVLNNKFELIGVVSWGFTVSENGVPLGINFNISGKTVKEFLRGL